MEIDGNRSNPAAVASNSEELHNTTISELEQSLKELQHEGGRYCVPFANDVLARASEVAAIRKLFNLQIERVDINRRELDVLQDRCLSLFKCYVTRDGDKVRIDYSDILICASCGAENEPDAIYCAECGRSFDEMRFEVKKDIDTCEKQARTLMLQLGKAAFDEARQNEAIRAAVKSDNLERIEENLKNQKKVLSRINELRKLEKEQKEASSTVQDFEYIVCENCGKKQGVDTAFCPDCGSPLSVPLAMRACPSCKVPYMGQVAYCMYCGSQTVDVARPQESDGERVCPNCGASVIQGKRFCTKCGTRVDGERA